jgi:stage II sporulation protein D
LGKRMLCWIIISAVIVVTGCSIFGGGGVRAKYREEPELVVYFDGEAQKQTMPLEEYLLGVVAAEIGSDWPEAALQAQSILARTFTIQRMADGGVKNIHGKDVDACTDKEHFQAYDAARVTDAVKQAVQQTRGQIVTYRGEPIRAWFHAHSGGQTATPKEGLDFDEPVPYLDSRRDEASGPGEWRATFTAAEVIDAAAQVGQEVGGAIEEIAIGARGPSGRALELVINGSAVSAPEFRIAIGSERFRSTLLDEIKVAGERVIVTGRGYGHGVGMSQVGARKLAEEGRSAPEIIKYYYKNVQIEDWWA